MFKSSFPAPLSSICFYRLALPICPSSCFFPMASRDEVISAAEDTKCNSMMADEESAEPMISQEEIVLATENQKKDDVGEASTELRCDAETATARTITPMRRRSHATNLQTFKCHCRNCRGKCLPLAMFYMRRAISVRQC